MGYGGGFSSNLAVTVKALAFLVHCLCNIENKCKVQSLLFANLISISSNIISAQTARLITVALNVLTGCPCNSGYLDNAHIVSMHALKQRNKTYIQVIR
jgi:hypothetical protein